MSSVWPKSTSGLRSCRALSGVAASSSARTVFSEPFSARPMGVRTASTITASGIQASPWSNPGGHAWYWRAGAAKPARASAAPRRARPVRAALRASRGGRGPRRRPRRTVRSRGRRIARAQPPRARRPPRAGPAPGAGGGRSPPPGAPVWRCRRRTPSGCGPRPQAVPRPPSAGATVALLPCRAARAYARRRARRAGGGASRVAPPLRAQRATQAARAGRRDPDGARAGDGLDPPPADEGLGDPVAHRARQGGSPLGGIEALESEPASVARIGIGGHTERAEGGAGVRAELHDAVGPGRDGAPFSQGAVELDPQRAGEMPVARARLSPAALGRSGDTAGDRIEHREQRPDARVADLVDRLTAGALHAHESGLAQAAQVVGELGHRNARLARELADGGRAGDAEVVDNPQPQR